MFFLKCPGRKEGDSDLECASDNRAWGKPILPCQGTRKGKTRRDLGQTFELLCNNLIKI